MYHSDVSPKNWIVEMYHAVTPASVMDHISKSMASDDGHVHVLTSTVAFGMGVTCKPNCQIFWWNGIELHTLPFHIQIIIK